MSFSLSAISVLCAKGQILQVVSIRRLTVTVVSSVYPRGFILVNPTISRKMRSFFLSAARAHPVWCADKVVLMRTVWFQCPSTIMHTGQHHLIKFIFINSPFNSLIIKTTIHHFQHQGHGQQRDARLGVWPLVGGIRTGKFRADAVPRWRLDYCHNQMLSYRRLYCCECSVAICILNHILCFDDTDLWVRKQDNTCCT